jgi:hypothetical protein
MFIAIESLPTTLSAFTVKLNAPAAAGVPAIYPVLAFKLKPGGSSPFDIDHVIGVAPVATTLWL